MSNKFSNLHLETIDIEEDYMSLVTEDMWENDEYPAFYLTISEVQAGICYECALLPFEDESEDMDALNTALSNAGHEVNSYGWEEYLCAYIEKQYPALYALIQTDSEAETCGIYVLDHLSDYRTLLSAVYEAVRSLLQLNID